MKHSNKVLGALLGLSVALSSSALALTIGDGNTIGYVNPGLPASDAQTFAQTLVTMYNAADAGPDSDGTAAPGPNTFTTVPANFGDFGVLPAVGPEVAAGGGDQTSINVGSGYLYLWAKYDGPNAAAVLWYIGGLTGTVEIPLNFSGDSYAVSHTSLFNPTTTVPDGGTTALLLGSALLGLALIQRKLFC